MGTEYTVICLRCNAWADLHKLTPCADFVVQGIAVGLHSMCHHQYPRENWHEYCIFQERGATKFEHFADKLKNFLKVHPYDHYPIIVSEHADITSWILNKSDWISPFKEDMEMQVRARK